jgi:hypothetical protein
MSVVTQRSAEALGVAATCLASSSSTVPGAETSAAFAAARRPWRSAPSSEGDKLGAPEAEGGQGGEPAYEYTIVDARVERIMRRELIAYSDAVVEEPEFTLDAVE